MKICADCFRDLEIRSYISSISRENGFCNYCSHSSELLDITELEDFFKQFFSIFEIDRNGTPFIELIQKDWQMFTDDEAGKRMLNDILFSVWNKKWLPETLVKYNEEILDCINYWLKLKDELKWQRRFLTSQESLQERGWDICFENYSQINSEIILYRARLNQNGTIAPYETSEMGCPSPLQSCGGRANPNGIPYLYLCKELKTTLYETRASYLDRISIGKFRINASKILKIVDFKDDQSPLNFMDDMINKTKGKLLRKLISKDLSKPMRRFDPELEYIPTQFICEFIKYYCHADGIQFTSSVNNEGTNIVLFNATDASCFEVIVHQIDHLNIESRPIL